MNAKYSIELSKDEEKVAQLLTRDAWVYFTKLISQREIFHVKDVPMMPRRGLFTIACDEELLHYYLNFSTAYTDELTLLGWSKQQISAAVESFVIKLENATGLKRGGDLLNSQVAN